MAAINDLLRQIPDRALRERLEQEFARINKSKKFGLVFEEHIPECTPLYNVSIRLGSNVAKKAGRIDDIYTVIKLNGEIAVCLHKASSEVKEIPLNELVTIAQFGEPIFPSLTPIARVNNAPEDNLWHTLIEADNYHALQLLEYLYPQQVDCIYIDPPYNTGARDWKYNNDYVDSADAWRHSKWLSMMQKRLKIAKRILKPTNSVMIITIDEKEYLHLGCLLEEMFPEARIQMVSVAIHSAGVSRAEFSRTDEYYYFVFLGNAAPKAISLGEEWNADGTKRQSDVRWESMLRSGNNGRRKDRPNLFFPVHFDKDSEDFVGFGTPIPFDVAGKDYIPPEGCVAVLPYASDGSEACWRISAQKAMELKEQGAFDWGAYKGDKTTLKYLKPGELSKIKNGEYAVTGYKDNGAMIISSEAYIPKWIPGTQWHVSSHQAGGVGGSVLIKTILGEKRFDFPKSVYAVRDSLRFITADTPNALIVDFFAGSGTTLHAVILLNAEDGGHRRCIMVTNNEVSTDEAKSLSNQGYKPGDPEWENLGIARYVTWPRTVCSIKGHDVNGDPLKGNYLGSNIPMADGFKTNAAYFKLSFLDKTFVALGRQFKEMLPTLWMKAGAHGHCPEFEGEEIPLKLILPKNKFAVLTEESVFPEFEAAVNALPEIETVYIITDYEEGYRAMVKNITAPNTYQLYRDYLDNFRINSGRN